MNISIKMTDSLGEIVVRYPSLRAQLDQLGLDYCCGGSRSLADAVRSAGLDLDEVLGVLLAAREDAGAATPPDRRDWARESCTALVQHIETTHHAYMKSALPRVAELLGKVRLAHGARHGTVLEALAGVYAEFSEEIRQHLLKEERVLFPFIREMERFSLGQAVAVNAPCGSVRHPIRQMEHEHVSAGTALAEMRRLTGGYEPPPDACPTFMALYEALRQIEDDLHQHIHLENNILFPKALRLE